MVAISWSTLVKSHYNIGPDNALNLHHVLWREEVLAAINMASKGTPFLFNLPIFSQ